MVPSDPFFQVGYELRYRVIFSCLFLDQSKDYLGTYAENTLVSIAESSPRPVKRIVEKKEQQSKQVKTKLKLIEVVDIFKEDTTGKRSTVKTFQRYITELFDRYLLK